ncbi:MULTISPECIES: NAD-glutamate dehydrogenase [unclassified Oleiphilus]|nr:MULTISPECIES: NAD-glutamate dehydrogenase [unclassified Oleiphilus]KZY69836.1 NAD-glutamate dehydrogenase [Oleiphilus sp. HI0067]KZY72298.1 NAD-glutamate dehydrogenase [Oleiphilus sp. HI0066]
MKLIETQEQKEILEILSKHAASTMPKQEQKPLIDFIEYVLASAYTQEFVGKSIVDVFGYFVSKWRLVNSSLKTDAIVQIDNPGLEVSGWQSPHTVISVLMRNIPFIVDSIRMALADKNLRVQGIQHTILHTTRDDKGSLKAIDNASSSPKCNVEALMVIEVDRVNSQEELTSLKAELESVLSEVADAVDDYDEMLGRVTAITDSWKEKGHSRATEKELLEATAFLSWLSDNRFSFLGYIEYDLKKTKTKSLLVRNDDSALGILKHAHRTQENLDLAEIPESVAEHILRPDILLFAKSSRRARVHRPAYPDYIVVKRFNDDGEVIGERRFIGLYTARVFNEEVSRIPFLREKAKEAIDLSGYNEKDHSGKEFRQLLETFPRDELFQVSTERLTSALQAALYAQERRKVDVYMREDAFGSFVSVLVYVPRDLFNTDLRLKLQNILAKDLNAEDIDFNTHLSESPLARTQFNVKLSETPPSKEVYDSIRKKIMSTVVSWFDDLEAALNDQYGEEKGVHLAKQYRQGFNASYREAFTARRASLDLQHIDKIIGSPGFEMSFYRAMSEPASKFHCKLFFSDTPVTLSEVLPIFENMGFNVIGESPFIVKNDDANSVWIHDFLLESQGQTDVELSAISAQFEELFKEIWAQRAENDRFNRLLASAYLDWRQIAVLRSYARYMRQIRVSNSQELISSTLIANGAIVRLLLELFDVRFNPKGLKVAEREERGGELENLINDALESVPNLTEDKILRLYLSLIKATVRTNFYQAEQGAAKAYLSFKLLPRLIPDVPLPVPMFEIFVYSPRIEGVHLRGGRVARGGLRWSDRNEDYRTEVLGLVKAQQVKNSVIVPVGAKGGFVAKQLPQNDRDAFLKEGVECYKIFISALLDVTDNLVKQKVVHPKNTVCHDEDDYYLVVAADKGTATFSDIANQISLDRGHWLGDAFASGGSQGYDHKKMGITARGAWVSVQRLFKELGKDIQKETFSCVGIGDMSGDVFGNGMLLSDKTELVAAFNHLHIFIDPNPDVERSFKERKRLFELPRSSWDDYNKDLISRGGGVFRRDAKSIPLSPEIKKLIDAEEDSLAPMILINRLLKADSDLLWFGGIGTYVKAKTEAHTDCGDKANDGLRVNGEELRVKVIGEGGNLGMTQRSRIEYAQNGGLLNTDFIDNAAGVDCSDNEVNIKILLGGVVADGDMTDKQRNKLLHDMTDDVAEHVLRHNYRQTQAISIASHEAIARTEEYRRLMNSMELAGKLNRELEFLPLEEEMVERKSIGSGLTRPELAVLISYVKGDLKELLNDSCFTSDAYVAKEVFNVFPSRLNKKFGEQISQHQLHSEIVATQVANDMVNHMGISFVERLHTSTGANATSIALAYLIAKDVFKLDHYWESIEALDYKVPATVQIDMMLSLMTLIRRSVRWLIRNRRSELHVLANIERFASGVSQISAHLPDYLRGEVKESWNARFTSLTEQGVPDELASTIAGASLSYAALGIIEAHEASNASLERVAEVYYGIGDYLDLNWFAQQIDRLSPSTHWQALAREAFREDLDWQQRALTSGLLAMKGAPKDIAKRINTWMEQHEDLVFRWQSTLTELKASDDAEYAMYSVALRELLDLAQSTTHAV